MHLSTNYYEHTLNLHCIEFATFKVYLKRHISDHGPDLTGPDLVKYIYQMEKYGAGASQKHAQVERES